MRQPWLGKAARSAGESRRCRAGFGSVARSAYCTIEPGAISPVDGSASRRDQHAGAEDQRRWRPGPARRSARRATREAGGAQTGGVAGMQAEPVEHDLVGQQPMIGHRGRAPARCGRSACGRRRVSWRCARPAARPHRRPSARPAAAHRTARPAWSASAPRRTAWRRARAASRAAWPAVAASRYRSPGRRPGCGGHRSPDRRSIAARSVPTAAITATPSARHSSTIHRPRTPPRSSRRASRSQHQVTAQRSDGVRSTAGCREPQCAVSGPLLATRPAGEAGMMLAPARTGGRIRRPGRPPGGSGCSGPPVRIVRDQQQRGAGLGAQPRTAGPSPPRRSPGRGCRSARRPAAAAARGAKARASATRCCSPPESWPGRWVRRCASPTASSAAAAGSPASRDAGQFQRHRHVLQRRHASGSGETPGTRCRSVSRRRRASASSSSAVTSWPASRMLPAVARSSPASTISRLVLPEPDGPMRPTASPAADVEIDPAEDVDRSGGGRHGQEQVPDLHQRRAVADGNRRRRNGIHGGSIWRPRPVAEGRDRVGPDRVDRDRAAGARARPPVRLLVLGDSLSAGYGLPHDRRVRGAACSRRCAHRAMTCRSSTARCRATPSAGGLARLDWVLGDGADAAIVELGANDGLRGVDPAEMEANLTAILDKLAARHIPVLLSGMYAPPNLGPDYECGVSCGVRPAGASGRACCTIRSSCRTWRRSQR